MSIRRSGRDINGILLLDKPLHSSSNQALTEVKKLFNAKKAGHTGSLDPLATGMLPICFGEATKFSQFLLEADKEYLVEAQLGIRTTTGDKEGPIIAQKDVTVSLAELEDVLNLFKGEIQQIPSMFSALKHQGKPLYSYARQGIEIERPARKVIIQALELTYFAEDIFKIRVKCSKGTYIRTLVEDIGEKLHCGAHVTSLKRTFVSPYDTAKMSSIDELVTLSTQERDQLLISIDSALMSWPKIELAPATHFYIKQGQPVIVAHAPVSGCVRLYNQEGHFLGIGEILDDGRVAPKRLIANKVVKQQSTTCV